MNKDRHADITLIYFKSPTLEVGVFVIKTGIDPLYGTEYTTLFWLAFIAVDGWQDDLLDNMRRWSV